MRKSTLLLLFGLFVMNALWGQIPMRKPSQVEIANSPAWVQMMYDQAPNTWAVDSAYRAHFRQHAFTKSYHTQYYKRWRKAADAYVQVDGSIAWPTLQEIQNAEAEYLRKRDMMGNPSRGANWTIAGPQRIYNNNNVLDAHHTNVYSLAQCTGTPSVMYAGTEPGEVYRSNDGGTTWFSVTDQIVTADGVTSVAASPVDPDIALYGAGSVIKRSSDGGSTWTTSLSVSGLNPNEIQFHPTDPSIVLAATDKGLYRSTDGGQSFISVSSEESWDVKFRPGNPNVVYTVRKNSILIRHEFFISTDAGTTWTLKDNGWYTSTDPARTTGGARIAVTPADTNRVYAYLIGEAKANDYGFIGVYKSTDGGETWALPNGPTGGPYSANHPNLAIGTTTWLYHQGFYNCALMASNTNADQILIGGLNLWRSDDGGATFSSVSGYIGGPLSMHVDNQDFRVFGNEYWISTDGGIYRNTDFYTSQPVVSMDGIHGSDYWGFGAGWNHDVLVGGLYHNGNNAWYEGYGAGNHLSLGGGEAATGYVNPGNNFRTYFSDIGGKIIPQAIGLPVTGAAFGMSPNETYFSAESSELEFHPNCYNIAYLGNDHNLWRTEDGGGTFSLVHTFGTDVDSKLRYIEISRSNPDIILLSQQPSSGNNGTLWRTTDGGLTWNSVPLPAASNRRKILIALDAEDPNIIYLGFPQAGNGTKVYRTTNGGTNWGNLTTSDLDGESIHSMLLTGGTDGGLYLGTNRTVFYRDNTMSNWVLYDQGLPVKFSTNIIKPFYRDGLLRIASYGKGIWSSSLHTQPTRPIATITVDKLSTVCDIDSFYFEDYSMLNHSGATWNWTFQNGSPASSTIRNPVVSFSGTGQHMVTLEVQSGTGPSARDTLYVEVTGMTNTQLVADFETTFPPLYWSSASTGNLSWVQDNTLGGFGNSSAAASCDNYNIDAEGTSADMLAYVNLDSTQAQDLTFDVAYAEYGGQYTDTLEVLVSTDCGATFTQLYRKGGQSLATAPNFTSSEFIPTASQWRKDTVDLSAYSLEPKVIVAFRCIGHWGQVMYLDNVNLNGTPIVGFAQQPKEGYIHLAPNPVVAGEPVALRTDSEEAVEVKVYDLQGKLVRTATLKNGERFQTAGLSAAGYVWEAHHSQLVVRGKLNIVTSR